MSRQTGIEHVIVVHIELVEHVATTVTALDGTALEIGAHTFVHAVLLLLLRQRDILVLVARVEINRDESGDTHSHEHKLQVLGSEPHLGI